MINGEQVSYGIQIEKDMGYLFDIDTQQRITESPVSYDEEYFEDKGQEWRMEKARRQVNFIKGIYRIINSIAMGPTVLDVGSGYGHFLKAIREKGWTAIGVEISTHARKLTGVEYANLDEVTEFFDIVTMWDFIEHVSDPISILKETYRLLGFGSLLFIKTPNLFSIDFEEKGTDWHSFKPEHLVYFSPPAIVKMLDECGFEVVFLTTESRLLRPNDSTYDRLLKGSDILLAARKI